MKSLTGIQKIILAVATATLVGGVYFFYQTGASTFLGFTLRTNPDLNRGLVGHWTFDGQDMDWSSTTAEVRDASGQRNNGNASTSLTSQSTTGGVLGQAIKFNGVSNSIDLGTGVGASSLLLNEEVSSFAWVKVQDGAVFQGILVNADDGCNSAAYKLVIGEVPNKASIGWWGATMVTSNTTLQNNEWYFLGFTRSGSAGNWTAKLYINGSLDDTVSGITSDPAAYDQRTSIGKFGRCDNYYSNATIDDVRIYNRALSADEVKRLYQLGATTKIDQTLNTNPELNNGLVGHWTFDGTDVDWSSTTAEIRNSGTMQIHASAEGGMNGQSVDSGVLGQAVYFDGVDDYIDTGNTFTSTSTITLAAWVKASTQLNGSPIFGNVNGLIGSDGQFLAYDNAGVNGLGFSNGTGYLVNTPEPFPAPNLASDWHHVTYTNNGTDNRMYLDGTLVATSTLIPLGTGNESTLNIGRFISGGGPGYFAGLLDDARIYNRALSADEVKRLYQLGATTKVSQTVNTNPDLNRGLTGHWTFDGPDMTDKVYDTSGNGNHGYIYNVATSSTQAGGIMGQGLYLNGTNGYVLVPGVAGNKGTLSTWVRPEFIHNGGCEPERTVIANNDAAGHSLFLAFSSCVATRYWKFVFRGDYSSLVETASRQYSSDTDLQQWAHLVTTWDKDAGVQVFLNGRLESTNPATTSPWNTGTSIRIGLKPDDSYPWKGTIDDVRSYNRVLSADEILRLYQQGSGGSSSGVGFRCGSDTVTDADNNVYNTVLIGRQCWMKQNMRVGTRVGISTTQTNNATIEKWCYSDSDSNCTANHPSYPDGGLYQWDEAMQYSTTEGAQGICPSGWHIPSDTDFKTLEMSIGMSQGQADATGYRGTIEGTNLKPNGISGFEANLAGNGWGGVFHDRGSYGDYWSSTGSGAIAWIRFLPSSSAQVIRDTNFKTDSFSIRCLKDNY